MLVTVVNGGLIEETLTEVPSGSTSPGNPEPACRVAVTELKLNHHNPKTILFTMYPYYGNLKQVP